VILKATAVEAASGFDGANDFVARVLASAPQIAVFDCDGTLWAADAGTEFLSWSIEQGMVSRETADWILGRYSQYRQGFVTQSAICGEMTQMYAGQRESEIRAAAQKFCRQFVDPQIFLEMRQLIEGLNVAGAEVWAVSSTNFWVIEAAMERFGISPERVRGTRVQVRDGVATSELIAVPTGAEKVEALRIAGIDTPDAVFGNSIHDAAMLAIAVQGYAVNPTPALQELAEAQPWPIYWPAAVLAQNAG
jgi:phosphoserine phosphatase